MNASELPLKPEADYIDYVRLDGMRLGVVPLKARTTAVCEAALLKTPAASRFVPNDVLTKEMFQEALKRHPQNILYCRSCDEEDVQIACELEPWLVTQFTKKHRTPERVTAALKEAPYETLALLVGKHPIQLAGDLKPVEKSEYKERVLTIEQFEFTVSLLNKEDYDEATCMTMARYMWWIRPPMEAITDKQLVAVCALYPEALKDVPPDRQHRELFRDIVKASHPASLGHASKEQLLSALTNMVEAYASKQ